MSFATKLALDILAKDAEIAELRDELYYLRGVEEKYRTLLDGSIEHNKKMLGNIFKIAMAPGVIEAIGAHNAKAQGAPHE